MTTELSKQQREILVQTSPVDDPAAFQTLQAKVKARMDQIVKEVQEPNQPANDTLAELRDLAVALHEHEPKLDSVNYGAAKRTQFLDSIRLLSTAHHWFGEGIKQGAFRARPVGDVLAASRPWRARLKAYGGHAFVFDETLAEQFADVNSTNTLDEEVDDLLTLNKLVEQHDSALREVGMTEEFAQLGKTLLQEAQGRDMAAIIGVRNQKDAILLRNRILTFATLLGREARAAGLNACHDDEEARRRFERASFRQALRATRKRGTPKSDESAPAAEPTNGSPGDAAKKPA
ncbi:MAG: hypothetical protein U0441_11310 [Polyangiaceae bacterium]